MSAQKEIQCNCRELLVDQETWEIILDPAFCNDSGAADCLAHLLFSLREAITSGPQGCIRVMNTLQHGIRMVWPYTEEHKLARELYELYLSGDLKPWAEPRTVLQGALESFKTKNRSKAPQAAPKRKVAAKTQRRSR